jgi:hypothetical protein
MEFRGQSEAGPGQKRLMLDRGWRCTRPLTVETGMGDLVGEFVTREMKFPLL